MDETLDAQGVEALIFELAQLRATLDPPVASHTGQNAGQFHIQQSPAMEHYRTRTGSIRIYLRNVGYGWMMFELEPQRAMLLRDYLIANTAPQPTELIGTQIGKCGH